MGRLLLCPEELSHPFLSFVPIPAAPHVPCWGQAQAGVQAGEGMEAGTALLPSWVLLSGAMPALPGTDMRIRISLFRLKREKYPPWGHSSLLPLYLLLVSAFYSY